jgi:ubiquinol-cytochrome c reductase cytochrome c1 subunit
MFGLVPPDLSLMTKARRGGSRYVYSLFAGFQADENGNVENHVFPGIQMPDIFSISLAASDKEREAILANIADVSAFLEWASDPSGAERESLGYYVLAYIVALSVLYYLLKKRIWQRVKRRNEIAQEQSAAASTNATLQS